MMSVTMPRPVAGPLAVASAARPKRRRVVWWYVAGALIALAIPLISVGVLEPHHDLFLLMYFTVAGALLASFAAHFAATGVALAAAWIVLASGVIYTERRRLLPSAEG